MAFVRRKVTEEDISFLEKYDIRSPYGPHWIKLKDEIVVDEENDFYMFYVGGPGVKREHLLLYMGFVWKKKYGTVGTYKTMWGKSLKEACVKWDIQRVIYDNKSILSTDNKELDILIKEALITTNYCFTDFTIVSTEFGVIEVK